MSDFEPITTQEDFDARLKGRLERERQTVEKRYEGWLSPAEAEDLKKAGEERLEALKAAQAEEIQKHRDAMAEKDKAIEQGARYKTELEKIRIADSAGLPLKWASRIVGETPDDWKKDAEEMAKEMGRRATVAPVGNSDGAPKEGGESDKRAAFRRMIKGLEG